MIRQSRYLEHIIDMANNKYRNTGVADVRKIPTPVKILNNTGNRITGHLEKATWVDYSGVYKGKAIIFDAKETGITNLPLDSIHTHQYELLKSWHRKGAIAFLIVYFKLHDKYYLLPFETLREAWETRENGGRKSIAWETFENECIEVKSKDGYTLHYLDALEV
ncbi:Holliday junction resolvase RecU [Lysinibacillus xylanilyticus]|uniref:Holliday junction resolvase RecU n=1 Tax=Lysinibacillus xylanilyticus TaxID=582475 RepID=UPI0034A0B24F